MLRVHKFVMDKLMTFQIDRMFFKYFTNKGLRLISNHI